MFQTIVDNITTIVASIVLIGGFIWGIWKYGKKNIVSETTLKNRVTHLEEDFEEEKTDGAKHHKALYEKLDSVSQDVAFIRGKLE